MSRPCPSPVLFLFGLSALLWEVPLRAQLQGLAFGEEDMAGSLEEARSFQKYPTYDQYLQMMQGFAEDHPDICRLDTFGTSLEGRLLLALKISDELAQEESEARFLYTATIHGDEILGYVLLLRLADTLLSGYGHDPEIDALIEGLEIWLNPLSNPDGSFMNGDPQSLSGAQRENSAGTDLNRNFPDPGTGEEDEGAGREKETRQMMDFLREKGFNLSANLHGGEEVVNYPWDHTYSLHPDDAWFRFVSREYADEARAVNPEYMPHFTNGITNGADWYVIEGGRQDYVTYYLGGRELTLELSLEKMPPASALEALWQTNYRSLINYMAQGLYGVRGTVSDAATGDPLEARISVRDHDNMISPVHSRSGGDFFRFLAGGRYTLVASASGYVSDTLYDVEIVDHRATRADFELLAWPAGVAPRPEAPELSLYPNPARTELVLSPKNLPPEEAQVRILSTDGRLIYTEKIPAVTWPARIGVSHLSQGIYFLQLRCGSLLLCQKFIRH